MTRWCDTELDRLELGDRVVTSFYDDLALHASRRLAEALDVPWYVLLPGSWFQAFGVRCSVVTAHRTPDDDDEEAR